MSWSEPVPARRRLLGAALVLLTAGALTGCIRPLYGSAGGPGGSVGAELAAIEVEPIGDYLGHELRNELAFLLSGGTPAPVRYRLVVVPVSTQQGAAVDTLLGRSESATLALTAQYKLYAMGDKPAELTSGRAIISVNYDRTQERFANVRADRDARARGAKVLADQIRTQLAIYFSTRK